MAIVPVQKDEFIQDENATLLMQVFSLLPNAVHIKNRDHVWVEMNDTFAELMGYTREDLLGKTSFDVMPPREAEIAWAHDNDVLLSHGRNRNIKQIKNHKGETRWVEAQKSYFRSAGGNEYIIGVLTDLTELKRREAELVEAQEKSAMAVQARASFLANMGSDIRSPMANISKYTHSLRKTQLDPQQSEILNKLQRAGESLFRIIDDIMDFSKIDAGLMAIKSEAVNPNQLVEDVVSRLGVFARDKRLDLNVSTDSSLPDFVRADATRISQILMNLTENALKYTQKGLVLVSTSGRLDGATAEIDFCVRDTGPGIPEDKLKDVLGDFQDAAASSDHRKGVSGLGLSLCLKLARLMGGRLDIKSTPGKGTAITLTIRLPIDHKKASTASLFSESSPAPKNKILVVDDIRANYDTLQKYLKGMSLTADYASSAKAAARKLATAYTQGAPYSIIILDYLMPQVDGLLFLNSITQNAHYSDVEIIALSSVNDAEIEECFNSAGNATYLLKPVCRHELERAINSASVRRALKQA